MANSKQNTRGKPSNPKKTERSAITPNQVEEDDSIIGTMFLRSLAVFVVMGCVCYGIYLMTIPAAQAKPEVKTSVERPRQREQVPVELPSIPFTDITEASGVRFVHADGKTGERLLPETMGGGGGFLDYDNDGDQDILFVNSCDWPWTKRDTDAERPTMHVFENDGTGKYQDVTKAVGLDVTFYGMGPAFGDFDNDGWVDVFITAVGTNHLFHNEKGKFVDVTDKFGVAGKPNQWSCPAMWLDYDRDGKLDLLVGNYVSWSREIDLSLASTLVGFERSYGQPTNFDGVHLYLYHNDGDHFTEVGEKAGMHVLNPATKVPVAKTLGLVMLDANHDGWVDVCVANDTVQKFLFINKKDGTFEEQSVSMGVAFSRDGSATGSMGIDCGNYRNDESCAIAIGNFANEPSSLYLSDGQKASFTDVALPTGFGPQTRVRLKFGTFFADLDLDGRLDIVCSNGHLEPEIQKVQPTQQYEQPAQLFWNAGKKQSTQFVALTAEKTGADFQRPMVGRGASYADIDGDGDLDLLFIANGGPARLLRNDQKSNNHWLRVKLKDKHNTGAIGATIEIGFERDKMTRCISPTRSYLSQTELIATFGFGDLPAPKQLSVTWPDGTKQVVPIEKIDTTLEIVQSN